MRIGICAGHSVLSPGAVAGAVIEHDVCRAVVDATARLAAERGWVVTDPGSDKLRHGYPDYLLHRIAALRDVPLDPAIDMHMNAWADPATNYSMVVYGDGRDESRRAAEAIAAEFDALPWRSAGARSDASIGRRLAFVRRLTCPALVVEPLFISNPSAREWLLEERGAERIAELLVVGIGRIRGSDDV